MAWIAGPEARNRFHGDGRTTIYYSWGSSKRAPVELALKGGALAMCLYTTEKEDLGEMFSYCHVNHEKTEPNQDNKEKKTL